MKTPTTNQPSAQEAYQTLKAGQTAWAALPLSTRLAIITTFNTLLEEQKTELALILTKDMGKPAQQARAEIEGARSRITYFLEHTSDWLNESAVRTEGDTEEFLDYEPLGVIGNISAWNYPYLVGVNVIIPALLAGNSVLYKPSEYATETGLAIERLLLEAGVPEDVFIAVAGDGSVGSQLLDLSLDGYFFTGSHKTGVTIASRVAEKLVPMGLELGGKDPLYITDDLVDFDTAVADAVDGAFYNAGQSCCAVERVYVHEGVYDRFVEAFVKRARALHIGDPLDERTYIGPLARPEHLGFLQEQVDGAVAAGAKLLLGGSVDSKLPKHYPPTILSEVDHSMGIMREESFGPIIGVQKVSGDAEAVALMQDTDYGLTAAVYSADTARAKKILSQLDVGNAYINCCDRVSPYLPWVGHKQSGVGATLSYLGILAFVKPKGYHVRESHDPC